MRKTYVFSALLMFLFAVPVFAGVLEVVKGIGSALTTPGGLIVGMSTVALLWLFKAIPNDKIYGAVSALFRKLGVVVTLGLSRYKLTAPLWNKIIEPWFIDLFDNTVHAAITGFIEGLRTDNPPPEA